MIYRFNKEVRIQLKSLILISMFASPTVSLLAPLNSLAGTISSGGGDVITCNNSDDVLSLDYVVAKDEFDPAVKIAAATTRTDSLNRILKLIEQKLPQLSPSFKLFLQNINNVSDYSKPYVWNINYMDLVDINDENLQRLPLLCTYKNNYEVKQAVIRNVMTPTGPELKSKIIFDFNRDVFNSTAPLQLSFIYVHEWLWDISDDVSQNRKINYFLHSDLFEKLSPDECAALMQSFGVTIAKIR